MVTAGDQGMREAPGGRVLRSGFFNRTTVVVARSLIGTTLCCNLDGAGRRLVVTEVEAYDGPDDRASHAYRGMSDRNAVMFGPPGIWYVYLCYGVHWMLNIVTGKRNYPAAVLLRGAGEYVGPGRLTRGLGIDGRLGGEPALRSTGLWFEDSKIALSDNRIERTPRIGVKYAGVERVPRPYRFVLKRRSGG